MTPRPHLPFFKLALLSLALGAAAGARSQPTSNLVVRPSPFSTRMTNALARPPASLVSEITIDASQTGAPINPHIYGQYIEHLDRGVSDGIWAEMLEDRKFYYPVPAPGAIWTTPPRPPRRPPRLGKSSVRRDPCRWWKRTPTSDGIRRHHRARRRNTVGIYQEELGLLKGKSYTGYIVLAADGEVAPVTVSLSWGEGGANQAAQTIPAVGVKIRQDAVPFHRGGGQRQRAAGHHHFRQGRGSRSGAFPSCRRTTSKASARTRWTCSRNWAARFIAGRAAISSAATTGATAWANATSGRPAPTRPGRAWSPTTSAWRSSLRLCELLHAEPMVTVNTGFGDAYSAAAEVEYANGATNTPMGKLRAQNGHPEALRHQMVVRGQRNVGGRGSLGYMAASQYVLKHNWVEEKMRQADPGHQDHRQRQPRPLEPGHARPTAPDR